MPKYAKITRSMMSSPPYYVGQIIDIEKLLIGQRLINIGNAVLLEGEELENYLKTLENVEVESKEEVTQSDEEVSVEETEAVESEEVTKTVGEIEQSEVSEESEIAEVEGTIETDIPTESLVEENQPKKRGPKPKK